MNRRHTSPTAGRTCSAVAAVPAPAQPEVLLVDGAMVPVEEQPQIPPLAQWLAEPTPRSRSVALAPDDDVQTLFAALQQHGAIYADRTAQQHDATLWQALVLIQIEFPQFSDGRGFSSARLLRLLGYRGELRARGELLPDQYALLRRVGFDTVQISAARAQRQPAADWLGDGRWLQSSYQQRLRGTLV